jgi:alpha-glucosidase
MSLRGNVFVYYGEELGLEQGNIAFDDLRDPEAITNWPETLGRDGARTPMPWTGSGNDYGGFSDVKPWLPLQAAHRAKNVFDQANDPNSVLNLYRAAIALRNNCRVLREGDIAFVGEGDCLVFDRVVDGRSRRCVFNLGPAPLEYNGPTAAELCVGERPKDGVIPAYSGFISPLD